LCGLGLTVDAPAQGLSVALDYYALLSDFATPLQPLQYTTCGVKLDDNKTKH
jgi:hypothetical protein